MGFSARMSEFDIDPSVRAEMFRLEHEMDAHIADRGEGVPVEDAVIAIRDQMAEQYGCDVSLIEVSNVRLLPDGIVSADVLVRPDLRNVPINFAVGIPGTPKPRRPYPTAALTLLFVAWLLPTVGASGRQTVAVLLAGFVGWAVWPYVKKWPR